jgi:hypothetical protein
MAIVIIANSAGMFNENKTFLRKNDKKVLFLSSPRRLPLSEAKNYHLRVQAEAFSYLPENGPDINYLTIKPFSAKLHG